MPATALGLMTVTALITPYKDIRYEQDMTALYQASEYNYRPSVVAVSYTHLTLPTIYSV